MRSTRTNKNIKRQITLALVLGMIAVMPQAYALPSEGTYQAANAAKATIATASTVMNITGNNTNTALNWESFNVAKAETVNFKGAGKNYLNLIHDANMSKIMGNLNGGGGNIYLINPNGILFGADAKVNVGTGSLLASARAIPGDTAVNDFETSGTSPLAAAVSSAGGNITNLGTLQANSITFEGKDVTLTNRTNIKNADGSAILNTTAVNIKASGTVTVGYDPGTTSGHHNYVSGTAPSALSYKITDLAGTDKSQRDAMIVSNVYDLNYMDTNLAGHYVLTGDIDASATATWNLLPHNVDGNYVNDYYGFIPQGMTNNGITVTFNDFTGTLEGAYCTVNKLHQFSPDNNVGLFAEIGETGSVSRLNINGDVTGQQYVGAIAGFNKGTISEVSNASAVTGKYAENKNIGGIAGGNSGTIINATNSGTVSGTTNVAGLVGLNSGTITNALNTGAITGTSTVGGIIGTSTGGTLTNLVNKGEITSDVSAGGLIYSLEGGTLTIDAASGLKETTNYGAVTAGSAAGGIAALVSDANLIGVAESYKYKDGIPITNTGAVTGKNGVGGIIGSLKVNETGTFTFKSLKNTGDVLNNSTSSSSGATGGLIGELYATSGSTVNISFSLNESNVTSNAAADTGGIIGAWTGSGTGNMTYVSTNPKSGSEYYVVSGTENVGGSIGRLETGETGSVTYIDSYNYNTVEGTGSNVGGIVGRLKYTGNIVGGIVVHLKDGTLKGGINNYGNVTGAAAVGGIVGLNESGTITNNGSGYLTNSGTVKSTDTEALYTSDDQPKGSMAGGIVGINDGEVSYVINKGAVSGSAAVGGIVGYNKSFGKLKQSVNSAAVTSTGTNAEGTGGVAGYSSGSIASSNNSGTVSGVKSVGGIVGMNSYYKKSAFNEDATTTWYEVLASEVDTVYNTGAVSGSGENVGGIAGLGYGGNYTNVYNTGTVSGGTNVGGLIGKTLTKTLADEPVVENQAPWGETGDKVTTIAKNTLTNTYNTGAVTGTTVGGLVGSADAEIVVNSSFYATTNAAGTAINGTNASGLGTAKTLAEMKQAALYADWDLDSVGGQDKVWRIYQGDTTPLLKNWLTKVTVSGLSNQSVVYDGAAHAPDVTGVTYTPEYPNLELIKTASGTAAGSYAMLYSSQNGYDLVNDPTFTISKAVLNFVDLNTSAPANYTYGASVAPVIDWNFSGFAGTDTYDTVAKTGSVSFDTSAAFSDGKTANAGTYTYSYNGDLSFANYRFTTDTTGHGTGTITVNKAPLTVAAGAAAEHGTYGSDPSAKLGYGLTGLKYADTASVLTGTPNYTTAAWNSTTGKTGDAGTYNDVVLTGLGTLAAANYTLIADTVTTGSITLDKAAATVTPNAIGSVTYGNTAGITDHYGYTLSGLVNGDSSAAGLTGAPIYTTMAVNGTKTNNVGTNDLTAAAGTLSSTNYTFTGATTADAITITKATLTLTPKSIAADVTYGDTTIADKFGYNTGTLVNGDTSIAGLTGAAAYTTAAWNGTTGKTGSVGTYNDINVGTGTLSSTNYDFAADNTTPGSVTLVRAPLTITANPITMTYGQAENTLTYGYTIDAVNKLVNGDTAAGLSGITYTNSAYNDNKTKDVASGYTVTAVVPTLTNYTVTANTGAVTMNKAAATVTPNAIGSVTYGSTAGITDHYGYTLSGLVNGDSSAAGLTGTPTYTTTAVNGNKTNNVGTYDLTAAAGTLSSTNYTFTGATTADAITITKATLTLTPKSIAADVTYGDTTIADKFGYNTGTLVNGDTSIAGLTGAAAYTTAAWNGTTGKTGSVGTYNDINVGTGTLSSTNYDFAADNTTPGSVTLVRAPLTITANPITMTYGQAESGLTYGYTVDATNKLVNGDTAAVLSGITYTNSAYNGTKTKDVASGYTVTAAVPTLTNYTVTTNTGAVTMNKAAATVTPNVIGNVVYGNTAGITDQYGYTLSGLVNGDTSAAGLTGTAAYTTTAVKGTKTNNVGTYDLTAAAGTLASTNYTFTGAAKADAITITPATVTIKANNVSNNVTYGDTDIVSQFGYSASGLVNGDTTAVISGTPTYTTDAWNGSKTGNAGTYSDVVTSGQGSLSAANYVFTLDTSTKGSVTITPAALTLTADKVTMREGDAMPASFTGNVSGYVNGDSAAESPVFNWTGSTGSSPSMGTYGIIGYLGGKSSGLYGTNYYLLQNPGNNTAMTITSRLNGRDYAMAVSSLIPRHGNQIVTPLYGMWVSQPAGTVSTIEADGQKAELAAGYYVDLDNQRHYLQ